ncbi:restriction endonuclease subunit S [Campylobacter lanienae]|uniref:restriction endonuclease subunit S n=1 Tax=Campylobacter lanienae TaxID=75658 RepID=UPI000BB3F6D0|nr:restriction endonuclease subunit S [Campylobacter lanienae]
MSKLEELINKLCPNGVEFKNLDKVCSVSTGNQLNKNKLLDDAKYPVINGGINPSGYWHEYNTDKDTITISQGGASAGFVNYMKKPFWAGAHCYVVKLEDESVNYRYLFYCLKSLENKLQQYQQGAGIPSISRKTIYENRIPVPPLEVQCEIVRILDNFTLLSAELSAELSARQKQYEYYKKSLIDNNTSKEIPLKDIIKKSCSGGTPLKSKKEFYENGSIPWLRTQEVKFNEIYEISGRITEEAIKFTSAKWIPENCIIVAMSGASAGRCAINKIETTTNQHCLNLEIDDSKALYKYVFYCVCSKYDELIAKKEGARGDLNSSKILNLKIPLPPLKEQERIVNILDRFDKLCNNLSEGLPAEIEARKKQYEYYRDKLLTFKELK